jgi:hypothetical protein
VEYEKPQKLLHKKDNAKMEGSSHLSEDIESGKSEDMKTQKEDRLCLVASCDRAETNDTTQATISNSYLSDSRDVTSEQTRAKIDKNDKLSDFQKEQLFALLLRYKSHLTKQPGRCNQFEYKFEIIGDMPKSRNARPILFSFKTQVREQIQEMLTLLKGHVRGSEFVLMLAE